jgi:NADPH:quinone reductase-like Zn-dependent oxidoreductase
VHDTETEGEADMRAMVCRAWVAPDVLQLENVPSHALRPGEVRIRVRAAGVNFADSLMVGGTYQVKPHSRSRRGSKPRAR